MRPRLGLSGLALVCPILGALGCVAPGVAPESEPVPQLDNPWFAQGRAAVRLAAERSGAIDRARNAILFVGDGMSLTTVTAARILEGQQRSEPGEGNWLAFERLPYTALAKTYNTDMQVADSAGTMAAMMSGVKTRAGVLGVDERVVRGDHTGVAASRVATLLEQAEARKMATGVVSTASVTHATPAACYAHVPERNWENDARLPAAARAAGFPDIARQLVELSVGDGVDVVLGGGRAHFLPETVADPEHESLRGGRSDGRNLVDEWSARHPEGRYVWRDEAFRAVNPAQTSRLLGLFEPAHMQFEANRGGDPGGEPSLAEMTATAIRILSRDPDGFFLMVEAGRIDHAHHGGNAYRALTDTIELSNAVAAALRLTSPDETLIVVTADHSHTLTFSGYSHRGADILGLATPPSREPGVAPEPGLDALGLPYTTLSYANGPGYTGASGSQPEGSKRAPHWATEVRGIEQGRPDLHEVDTADPGYLQEATVPLLTETHAGEDVPVYAGGPGAELFHGVREQSYVYHALTRALGWWR